MQKILQSDKGTTKLKTEEFRRGKNPDGSIIGSYRSSFYAREKQRRNPLARGFVDLMDTKSYVNKLFVVKVNRLQYQFQSSDEKDAKLARKYGQQIRGLSSRSFNSRADFYSRQLGLALKKRVGL